MAGQAIQLNHLSANDTAARCVTFPKHFAEGEVFSPNACMLFDKLDSTKKPNYAISVVPRSLLRDEIEVHQYGCRTASTKNMRTFVRKGIDAPLSDRAFYLGFYEFEIVEALKLACSEYVVQAVLVPENGEAAHSEVQLIANTVKTPKELKEARGDLLLGLIRLLRGPNLHVCDADEKHAVLIDGLKLPILPANQNSPS